MNNQQSLKTEALVAYKKEMTRISKMLDEVPGLGSNLTEEEKHNCLLATVSNFTNKLESILKDGLAIGGIIKKVMLGYNNNKEVMLVYKKGCKKVYYSLYKIKF